MSFQSKFKGKVNLIGKDGTIAAISSALPVQHGQPIIISENKEPSSIAFSENGEILKIENSHGLYKQGIPKSNSALISVPPKMNKVKRESILTNLQMAGYNQIYQAKQVPKMVHNLSEVPISHRQIIDYKPTDRSTISSIMKNYTPNLSKEKYLKSQKYSLLGGLGPNIGTEDWNARAIRKSEMLKYASNVNHYNKEKLLGSPKRIEKAKDDDVTDRHKAIQYSRQLVQMLHSSSPVINHPLNSDQNIKELEEIKCKYTKMIDNLK